MTTMPRPAEWTFFFFFLPWTYSNSVKTKTDSMLKSQLLIEMKILVAQLCLTLWDPVNHSLPGASLSMGLSRQEYWSGSLRTPPGDLLHPGMESTSIALASGFFTAKPPRKPLWHPTTCPWNSPGKKSRVGCHFHLQWVFPTQGQKLGLLYCSYILCHLNNQQSNISSAFLQSMVTQ